MKMITERQLFKLATLLELCHFYWLNEESKNERKCFRNCETLMKPFNRNSMKCKQTNQQRKKKEKETKKKNLESLGKLL